MMIAMGLNLGLVAAVVLLLLNAGRYLGPRPNHQGDAEEPYETGLLPFGPAVSHMSVLYYKFAVLFVVFDVDLAFLLPWAGSGMAVDGHALAAISIFAGLITLMLAYFWKRGALEC